MSAYPNYSFQPQQMNNPYQTYGQPMQNPYIAQMGQYQQNLPIVQQVQQPQQQTQGLVCKPVVDASNVSPNDVPMDGNAAVFPKNDFSEIYVKSWTPNGTIQTVVYKPVQPENQSEGANMPQMDFNALNEDVRALREDILARLDSIEKSVIVPAAKTARGKKTEVKADE
ncbi:MAG: hypothetical protein HFH72_08565 [Lachnospiraceae bacterium]|nr:hypothetical protein [Lachnospiraceae bacterium]